jgi:uncharacterized protein YchJ
MNFFKSIANMFNSKDGQDEVRSLGRNELCWCGSGMKYKKCHLAEDEKKAKIRCASGCGKT